MKYNNNFKMQDFFQNPQMANVFPQFEKGEKLQNVYSFEWINKKVKDYLKNALNAQDNGNGLLVFGKHNKVLKDLQLMKWTIEAFINNIPSVTKNIRKNTSLYTPFTNLSQLSSVTDERQKLAIMNIILDNINYNPDFETKNSVQVYGTTKSYQQRQEEWMKKVNYKDKRSI